MVVVTCAVALAYSISRHDSLAPQIKNLPKFTDYPTGPVYIGANKPLDFFRIRRAYGSGTNDDTLLDRRLSRWNVTTSAKQRVNFASHFAFAIGTCGTDCETLTIYDAKTGMIYPWLVESHPTRWDLDNFDFPVDCSPTSSLAVFHGLLLDSAHPVSIFGDHYYSFSHHRFRHICSVLMVPPTRTEERLLGTCIVYKNPLRRVLVGQDGGHTFKVSVTRSPLQRGIKMPHSSGPGGISLDLSKGYSRLTRFEVVVDGNIWRLPDDIWKDCICPNLGIWPRGTKPASNLFYANISKDGTLLKITMYCGYGSERYKVLWSVTRPGLCERTVTDFTDHH